MCIFLRRLLCDCFFFFFFFLFVKFKKNVFVTGVSMSKKQPNFHLFQTRRKRTAKKQTPLDLFRIDEQTFCLLRLGNCCLGTTKMNLQMTRYISNAHDRFKYKIHLNSKFEKGNWTYILNARKLWYKIHLAARILLAYNPSDVLCVSKVSFTKRPVEKFASYGNFFNTNLVFNFSIFFV